MFGGLGDRDTVLSLNQHPRQAILPGALLPGALYFFSTAFRPPASLRIFEKFSWEYVATLECHGLTGDLDRKSVV